MLKKFNLTFNQLTSFSAEEGAFPNLKGLYLSDNQLTSFVAERGTFPNLKILVLSFNQLTSFVAERGVFPNLKKLFLRFNHNLEVIDISAPKLKNIWIDGTKVQFLDEFLIEKVQDRKDVQVRYHARGTKLLVLGSQHEGHPVVEEIVAHLTG